MKKSIASNSKIKYTLLSILFSILFIFTAIANPIEAHATDVELVGEDDINFGQVINLEYYDSNEIDESTNQEAGYLYYAASGDRCGVMFYVVDQLGQVQAHGVLLDEVGNAVYRDYKNDVTRYSLSYRGDVYPRYGLASLSSSIRYVPNVSTVYYSGGWKAKGSDAMNYLTSNVPNYELEIDGVKMHCPWWAYYVLTSDPSNNYEAGKKALKELAHPETKWQVFVEPVSVNYLYTESTFDREVDNTVHTTVPFESGSPIPKGTWVGDKYEPTVYLGTAYNLLSISNMLKDGGTAYTYKFYNKQFPYSMCLKEDVDMAIYVGGSAAGNKHFTGVTPPNPIPRLYSGSAPLSTGIAMAAIDIQGFSLPPIHTFDGTNTPGNTEEPKEEDGTTGECVIKKLYYTETLYPDGTVKEDADPQYFHYERRNTTAYVSIDNEDGYEIEMWKITSDDVTFTRKEHWSNIGSGWGDISAQVVRMADSLATDGANKYLYILYKKVVVLDEEEPSEYDFELQESQITKRVTFLESSTTSQLLTHSFSWTSPAHTPTACASHGGYGHRLNCNTEWNVAPVTGVPHNHATSGETSYYDCGYSYSCPAGCTINHTHHTHVNTDSGCYGYKKLKHTTLCPATCTTNHTHHYTHNINSTTCYEVCTKVWDVAPVTGVAHTHTNSCYDTPCSTFAFTGSTIKLGIKLDTNSVNKAVVSKKWGVIYDDTEVNTIIPNKYYGTFTRTSADANTISKSNYNAILLLFRGNDKLTLADWKNTSATTGYLTNIALDPAYNFKSANTPQGSRRAGDEYQETFTAKFINRSPDNQTTYKATVGTHGTCGSTKQYTFTKADGTSSAYTIDNITVNIKVFWANGVSPSTRGTISNNLVAGSASFYPYIRMRYDNNTQNDKKVYVLGQRNRSATFYDYASVSISSSGDPLLSINSNQYYLR